MEKEVLKQPNLHVTTEYFLDYMASIIWGITTRVEEADIDPEEGQLFSERNRATRCN